MIGDFLGAVEKYLEGSPGKDGLHQSIRQSFRDFTAAIRASAPDFRPCSANAFCENKIILPYPNVTVNNNQIIYLEELKELADT